MEELLPILGLILAVLGVGGAAAFRRVMKPPPERSTPKPDDAAAETEAAERRVIDERVEAAIAEAEEINDAPDRERTRRTGARLRE